MVNFPSHVHSPL
uniref:Uncharacterized protein n=1 Tax=Arundo donax TaxID=35708 RepID=A0A0A9BRZ0_ARUDO